MGGDRRVAVLMDVFRKAFLLTPGFHLIFRLFAGEISGMELTRERKTEKQFVSVRVVVLCQFLCSSALWHPKYTRMPSYTSSRK